MSCGRVNKKDYSQNKNDLQQTVQTTNLQFNSLLAILLDKKNGVNLPNLVSVSMYNKLVMRYTVMYF